MWTDDLEIVESCGFRRSLLNLYSNNSIGEYAATDTFANMKTPKAMVEPSNQPHKLRAMHYGSEQPWIQT